jgi:hypothetical protein
VWRRDVRPPSDSKSPTKNPRRFSRRGFNSCDDGYKAVICPTSQVSKSTVGDSANLHRRLTEKFAERPVRNPIEKARGRFPGAGSILAMLDIRR